MSDTHSAASADAGVDGEPDQITPRIQTTSAFKTAKRSLDLSLKKVAKDAEIQGRALPTSTDPNYGWSQAIRDAERIVDRDTGLIPWINAMIFTSYKREGRPPELSIRSFLIAAIAYVLRTGGSFKLSHLHRSMLEFPLRDQMRLGITRTRNGAPAPLTVTHVRGAHGRLAAAFDAEHADVGEDLRSARFEARQQLVISLLAATLPEETYDGGFALDGTFLPAFYRPTRRCRRARIRDPQTGEVAVAKIAPALDEPNAIWYHTSDDRALKPQPTTAEEIKATRAKLAKDGDSMYLGYPSLDGDAGWHVRERPSWGYNVVTMVRSAPDAAPMIEGLIVGSGNASEYKNGLRLVEQVSEARQADPEVVDRTHGWPILGHVIADRGFTQYNEWWPRIREFGGVPIAELNQRQQQPRAREFPSGDTGYDIGGHTYCGCLPPALRALRRPHDPTPEAAQRYQDDLDHLDKFRYKPNGSGPTRANGGWPHLAPHWKSPAGDPPGGCDHCTNPDGSAVFDDDGRPVPRCCVQRTQQLPPDAYSWRQPELFGSDAWTELFGRRNITESNNAALTYHHTTLHSPGSVQLRHLSNYTLVTLYAAVATNVNMLRTWRAQQHKATLTQDQEPDLHPPKRRGRHRASNRAEPARPRPPERPPGAARDPKGFAGVFQ